MIPAFGFGEAALGVIGLDEGFDLVGVELDGADGAGFRGFDFFAHEPDFFAKEREVCALVFLHVGEGGFDPAELGGDEVLDELANAAQLAACFLNTHRRPSI